ncbi:uncharacterized protein BO66DRAFT_394339 [Aspergillus aculeatinus CBS 121060]|uniref:Uncharacterized protein n=2 Tax=Aspergillus TaxID=5052 RepID=A0A8G1RM85_9EURO|nr:hypothetical protein BO66DRAFT_394339 [Aspergillus aculeatinus CBS 121060]XP_040798748.1 uncharacterized protein BO72DRAFT_450399 [Aspergillus fijiensis CBS 313.89]RAH66824.1 hypothetical protein BO66DRAFT_394339 [Aspergillus aculeatinus CBS 121060]RAK74738.1 hypothetical protein BO72DRAFT_450399 [Aspergillus fijiensis CBS 313.89]
MLIAGALLVLVLLLLLLLLLRTQPNHPIHTLSPSPIIPIPIPNLFFSPSTSLIAAIFFPFH